MIAVSDAITGHFSHASSGILIPILVAEPDTDGQNGLGSALGCLSGRDRKEGACGLPALGTELAVLPGKEAD